MERLEKDRIAKRVYVGECAGSRSMGKPRKRWFDTVKDCLMKRGLDVRQARRMIHDRSEWRGLMRGNTRCHSCGLPQLYEALEVWKSVCNRAYNLKSIKGKISVFVFFLNLCFSFTVAHFMA